VVEAKAAYEHARLGAPSPQNPKIAGSNPAPVTDRGPRKRAFLVAAPEVGETGGINQASMLARSDRGEATLLR